MERWWQRLGRAYWFACCALGLSLGCGDDDGFSHDDAGRPAGRMDAAAADMDAVDAVDAGPPLPPLPEWSGEFATAMDAGACSLLVGARCDGDEDCPGAQVCCGTFNQASFTYDSIECADRCDTANRYRLCHPGESCLVEGRLCTRSRVLPYEFISLCTMPVTGVVEGTGVAEAGRIACGDSSCEAAREHCCLRGVSGGGPFSTTALEPYCAPLDEACRCELPTDTAQDAGSGVLKDAATETPEDDGGQDDAG
ncbi:MAG: hypothetical protein OEZ06_22320 [Myxococcales bacterium]|nr:hypothetical protein [Myxococcales bacterium]